MSESILDDTAIVGEFVDSSERGTFSSSILGASKSISSNLGVSKNTFSNLGE